VVVPIGLAAELAEIGQHSRGATTVILTENDSNDSKITT
jgi:hypothetical protein